MSASDASDERCSRSNRTEDGVTGALLGSSVVFLCVLLIFKCDRYAICLIECGVVVVDRLTMAAPKSDVP